MLVTVNERKVGSNDNNNIEVEVGGGGGGGGEGRFSLSRKNMKRKYELVNGECVVVPMILSRIVERFSQIMSRDTNLGL